MSTEEPPLTYEYWERATREWEQLAAICADPEGYWERLDTDERARMLMAVAVVRAIMTGLRAAEEMP